MKGLFRKAKQQKSSPLAPREESRSTRDAPCADSTLPEAKIDAMREVLTGLPIVTQWYTLCPEDQRKSLCHCFGVFGETVSSSSIPSSKITVFPMMGKQWHTESCEGLFSRQSECRWAVTSKPRQKSGFKHFTRSGFTLTEVLLVLGVLVAFAGMTVPSVMRMFREQKLTGSAERVRAAIASARFRAIETGIIYQFCCETNGTRYIVVPFEPDHANAKGGTAGPVTILGRTAGHLPKGLAFSSTSFRTMPNSSSGSSAPNTTPLTGSPSHKLPPGALDGLPNASDMASANWSIPVLFHPEGSANADIEITISDSQAQHIKLHVRAFTGAVSMERLVAGKR
jgi:type II secretory pathway pseudopilin PulG